MNHVVQRLARSVHLAGLLAATGLFPDGVAAQPPVPPQAGTTLFVLDLAGTPVGEIPTAIKQLRGIMEVVLKDGVPMLKASAASEFRITLPQVLPQDFTLEFELVTKACFCNPQDLSFEGTSTINQGAGSAHVLWDSDGYLAVIGGGESYEAPMPEELRTTSPGVLTTVVAVFEGNTVRLYTNGRRLYTLSDRQFARGRVLRVFLGGQGDGANAVHLARLRLVAGAAPPAFTAAVSTTGAAAGASGAPGTARTGGTTLTPPAPGSTLTPTPAQPAPYSPQSTLTKVPPPPTSATNTSGLTAATSALGPTAFSAWSLQTNISYGIAHAQQLVVLTREKIESVLSAVQTVGGLAPGVVAVPLRDTDKTSWKGFDGVYTLYLRVERVP